MTRRQVTFNDAAEEYNENCDENFEENFNEGMNDNAPYSTVGGINHHQNFHTGNHYQNSRVEGFDHQCSPGLNKYGKMVNGK